MSAFALKNHVNIGDESNRINIKFIIYQIKWGHTFQGCAGGRQWFTLPTRYRTC